MYPALYVFCVFCILCFLYSVISVSCVFCIPCNMYSVFRVFCILHSVYFCVLCILYSVYVFCVFCILCFHYYVDSVRCVFCILCNRVHILYCTLEALLLWWLLSPSPPNSLIEVCSQLSDQTGEGGTMGGGSIIRDSIPHECWICYIFFKTVYQHHIAEYGENYNKL